MIVNGIAIPEEGKTTQYLPDNVGGWMYVVTTTVSVEQKNLNEFKNHLDDVKKQIVDLQALVAEIEPASVAFEEAVKDLPIQEVAMPKML